MNRILGLVRVPEGAERLAEQGLKIHLPRVDDVVNPRWAAEGRSRRIGVFRRCGPERPAVRLRAKSAVAEVAPEQAEFPELVRDVLADIRHDAVRSDDNLFPRVLLDRIEVSRAGF